MNTAEVAGVEFTARRRTNQAVTPNMQVYRPVDGRAEDQPITKEVDSPNKNTERTRPKYTGSTTVTLPMGRNVRSGKGECGRPDYYF